MRSLARISCAGPLHYRALIRLTIEVAETRLRSLPEYLGAFDPTTYNDSGSESPKPSSPVYSTESSGYAPQSATYAPRSPAMDTLKSPGGSCRGSISYSPTSPTQMLPGSPQYSIISPNMRPRSPGFKDSLEALVVVPYHTARVLLFSFSSQELHHGAQPLRR